MILSKCFCISIGLETVEDIVVVVMVVMIVMVVAITTLVVEVGAPTDIGILQCVV